MPDSHRTSDADSEGSEVEAFTGDDGSTIIAETATPVSQGGTLVNRALSLSYSSQLNRPLIRGNFPSDHPEYALTARELILTPLSPPPRRADRRFLRSTTMTPSDRTTEWLRQTYAKSRARTRTISGDAAQARNTALPDPMASKTPPMPSSPRALDQYTSRSTSAGVADSHASPQDGVKSKVQGTSTPDDARSEDLPYSDSEEETEQAHAMPPLNAANIQAARVKTGKSGSRAKPSSVPMPPPPRTDSLPPLPPSNTSAQGSMTPMSPSEGPGPVRRRTGGLSNKQTKSPAVPDASSMMLGVSQEGSEYGGSGSGRSLHKQGGSRRTDLSDWAPGATPVYNDNNAIDNLPNWNTMKPGDATSRPITNVEKDMDWSMRKLLSENVFQQLLDDPLGRHRFRNFLQAEGAEELLDFYFDLSQYQQQSNNLKQSTEALYDLYVAEDSDSHIQLPDEFSDELYSSLRRAFDVKVSLNPMQEHIRQSLYKSQFQRFIRAMLIEQNRVKLGVFADDDNDEYSGLGDCFCLTNPRVAENPIVLVSPGFVEVTGYPTRAILGRNCRFLQGPGTSPESVQRIRDALNAGRPHTELLLNYTKSGAPFFCLLSIIPLRDASGALAYFIGGQTNVTGTLASAKGLGFLVGNATQDGDEPQSHIKNGYELSPTMARHLKQNDSKDVGTQSFGQGQRSLITSNSSRNLKGTRNKGAAGAYDPSASHGPPDQTLMNNFNQMPRSSSNNSGFMSRIFSKNKPRRTQVGGPQRLLGAEGTMRQAAPGRLADQVNFFSDLYSRLIIFKRHKREVIFATRPLLETLGLPVESSYDVYNNVLLHADILSMMQGSNKSETKALRGAVEDAVREGNQISLMTGLRQPKSGLQGLLEKNGGENAIVTYRALHITPLHDRDSSSFAFVAVLG